MATHGSLSEFDSTKDDWTSYVERMDFYFIANDVTSDAKKRAILLSACGAPTFAAWSKQANLALRLTRT